MIRAPARPDNRRPRVLVAIGSLPVGGAERQIVEICRGLKEEIAFDVVTMVPGGPLEQPLLESGVRLHSLRRQASGQSHSVRARLGRVPFSTLRFRRLLKELRPDVIHAYLFKMSVLCAAARWPRRRPTLILSKRMLVEATAREPMYFPLIRWANRRADLVLANSMAVRDDVMRKEDVDESKIEVIYNGVDTERFRPGLPDVDLAARLGLPPGIPTIGMVANLHFHKGHEDLLRAAAVLRDRGLRLSILLVGREGMASDRIRETIRQTSVPHVVFAGMRDDVPQLLSLMDVFVSASHEEGFSNSILEAMSAGRAIVATRVGGGPEQIVDGESGLLVPRRCPEALADAIERCLRDASFRERLAIAARRRVEDRFSLRTLLEKVAGVYREGMYEKRGRPT